VSPDGITDHGAPLDREPVKYVVEVARGQQVVGNIVARFGRGQRVGVGQLTDRNRARGEGGQLPCDGGQLAAGRGI